MHVHVCVCVCVHTLVGCSNAPPAPATCAAHVLTAMHCVCMASGPPAASSPCGSSDSDADCADGSCSQTGEQANKENVYHCQLIPHTHTWWMTVGASHCISHIVLTCTPPCSMSTLHPPLGCKQGRHHHYHTSTITPLERSTPLIYAFSSIPPSFHLGLHWPPCPQIQHIVSKSAPSSTWLWPTAPDE